MGSERRRRRPTREELRLWQHVTQDVTPIRANPIDPEVDGPAPEETTEPPAKAVKPKVRRPLPPLPDPTPPRREAPPPEIGHGDSAGVDGRTMQRLRQGKLPIEGTLDLHGYNREEAHRALNAFLAASQTAGRRCVLVITGKGRRAWEGEAGVLKEEVPRWLNDPVNRSRIVAFTFARPRDGGDGALYILIRRRR